MNLGNESVCNLQLHSRLCDDPLPLHTTSIHLFFGCLLSRSFYFMIRFMFLRQTRILLPHKLLVRICLLIRHILSDITFFIFLSHVNIALVYKININVNFITTFSKMILIIIADCLIVRHLILLLHVFNFAEKHC